MGKRFRDKKKMKLAAFLISLSKARKLRTEELAYDYEDELRDFVDYNQLDATIGRGGLPERFYNLWKMLNHYKSDFDFGYTFQYGCNCLFKKSKVMTKITLGHPVDELDSLCHKWKACMRCAAREHGNWCSNEDILYSMTGVGVGFLASHQGGDDAICTDGDFTCGRSLCECDKLFGQQLEEAYESWSAELHVFLNDWNPYDECVRPPSSGALECCWNGESPFLTFNGETHVCCGDGSTATNLADCPAPTTPQPGPAPGGYGR